MSFEFREYAASQIVAQAEVMHDVMETKSDPAYAVSFNMYSPDRPIWTPKDYHGFVREGYKRNGTVYQCINKIAGTAAGIKWKLYTDKTMKREITSHPLLDRWQCPNPKQATGEFVESVFGFWHMSGNSYVWANRPGKNAPPDELWPLRPDRMKIIPGKTDVSAYIYGYGTPGEVAYDPEEIFHLKFPAYDDDWYGLSPIETASNLIDQQNEGNSWNTALMQNSGKPASLFIAKGFLTDVQRNQLHVELSRKYSGKRNAGMPLIMEGDLSYQNMSMAPYELDWLDSRKLNTREIASIFDVAPELVGDPEGKTYANVKEARIALLTLNVLPKLDKFRDKINAWFVPMFGDPKALYFTYDPLDIEALQELYNEQQTSIADRADKQYMNGEITLNEYREKVGLVPLLGGDCLRFGGVLVPVDKLGAYAIQSLQAPAAPPVAQPENILDNPTPGSKPNANTANTNTSTTPTPNDKQPAAGTGKQPAPGDTSKQPANAANNTANSSDTGKTPAKSEDRRSEAKDNQDGVYQPDDLQQRLAAYKAQGVTQLKWLIGSNACQVCSQNDGITVKLGMPFPSGHILPVAHPNCECETQPVLQPKKALDDAIDEQLTRLEKKRHRKNSYQEFMEAICQ